MHFETQQAYFTCSEADIWSSSFRFRSFRLRLIVCSTQIANWHHIAPIKGQPIIRTLLCHVTNVKTKKNKANQQCVSNKMSQGHQLPELINWHFTTRQPLRTWLHTITVQNETYNCYDEGQQWCPWQTESVTNTLLQMYSRRRRRGLKFRLD